MIPGAVKIRGPRGPEWRIPEDAISSLREHQESNAIVRSKTDDRRMRVAVVWQLVQSLRAERKEREVAERKLRSAQETVARLNHELDAERTAHQLTLRAERKEREVAERKLRSAQETVARLNHELDAERTAHQLTDASIDSKPSEQPIFDFLRERVRRLEEQLAQTRKQEEGWVRRWISRRQRRSAAHHSSIGPGADDSPRDPRG
jgi:outer membrane PBP1 activator LpoA protein